MEKKFVFTALLFCLAIFGGAGVSRPASASQAPADLLEQMKQEGWKQVAPGVMQRDLGNSKVETLGFGADGLRFKLDEMKAHLVYLREEYTRNPSPNLRRAIRAHRAEILRTEAALTTAKPFEEMESVEEKVAAGIDCTIKYGAHVDAFYLTAGSTGVGATTDSYFNSNCGQTGEVYAHAYGKATGADNVIRTFSKTDPATGIRSGGNVTASAASTVNGVRDCYSYSYATLTSYDLSVTYSQSVENRACPNPISVSVSSDSGSEIHLYGYDCWTVTWTASVSGGAPPYSVAWYRNNSYVGSGTTRSETFCGSNTDSTSTVFLKAAATDSGAPGQTASAQSAVTIYSHYRCIGIDPAYSTKATQPPCM
jgi:hypothetical protein